jgi:hypothetical protein
MLKSEKQVKITCQRSDNIKTKEIATGFASGTEAKGPSEDSVPNVLLPLMRVKYGRPNKTSMSPE